MRQRIIQISKSSILKSFSIYGGTTLINAAIPFLIVPILTRYMSTADYGYAAMFIVLCSFISPIIGFSTSGAISRQYYSMQKIKLDIYIGNCFILGLISLLPVSLFFLFFSTQISKFAMFPENLLCLAIIFSFFKK